VRPIKYRGYAVEEYTNGQWKYGTGIHVTEFTDEYAQETGKKEECFIFTESGWVEVKKESVGQFTDLKDKNGVEIYEGDIYLNPLGNKMKIIYEVEEARFAGESIRSSDRLPLLNFRGKLNGEVIGNIYDNPELLEETP
jgi:uncharacterized phage protein (TIGR01671 family)